LSENIKIIKIKSDKILDKTGKVRYHKFKQTRDKLENKKKEVRTTKTIIFTPGKIG
jgi:hypothetical protein